MFSRTERAVLVVAALTLACGDAGAPSPDAPRVTVTATMLPAVPAAGLVPCAASHLVALPEAWRDAAGAPAEHGDPLRHAALTRADLDGDGMVDVITVRSFGGAVEWRRRTGPCEHAAPVQIAPEHTGYPAGIHVVGDEILIGWNEGPPYRRIVREGGAWSEKPVADLPGERVPAWFVRRWQRWILVGLDAGRAWIEPDAPIAGDFADADPMGWAELLLDGKPHLFVSGLPGRSLLLTDALADAADAQVQGPSRAVSWGAHATDLDGDGADDVIALALDGTSADDGRPRVPRVLLQRGGALVAARVEGPEIGAMVMDCIGARCVAWSLMRPPEPTVLLTVALAN